VRVTGDDCVNVANERHAGALAAGLTAIGVQRDGDGFGNACRASGTEPCARRSSPAADPRASPSSDFQLARRAREATLR
jgi:hypothetical protein